MYATWSFVRDGFTVGSKSRGIVYLLARLNRCLCPSVACLVMTLGS